MTMSKLKLMMQERNIRTRNSYHKRKMVVQNYIDLMEEGIDDDFVR